MWVAYVIIAAALIIGIVIGLNKRQQINELRDEGKIIKRNYKFVEKGEEFTAKIGSYAALKQELESMPLPCSMKGNASSQVDFTSTNYAARLYKVDYDEPSGIGVFRFEYTRWKTARYGYMDETSMNLLMTSVEKVFLKLDPNTGVKFYDLNFKTSHSIF